MENYDFCEELKEKMNIKELNSDALYYQLDMFINACEMDIKAYGYSNFRIGDKKFSSINKDYCDEDIEYHFEIIKNLAIIDEGLTFRGSYNDLEFSFDTFYKENKLSDDIRPMPFLIQLRKEVNNRTYSAIISIFGGKTEYDLTEIIDIGNEQIFKHTNFYSRRNDIEGSFEVIHSFVANPKELFRKYEWEMGKKKVFFNSKSINSIKSDDLLVTNKGKMLTKTLK